MANNYNHIANIYDFISRIVYGKALINAQTCLLKHIPVNSSVLIVGGGTGWILEDISKLHSTGLTIDYIESSAKMISLSKKKNYMKNEINFINLPVENYILKKKYDVILTPFFFDNFQADNIQIIFTKLNELLNRNGTWLYADFVYDKNKSPFWQKFLLKTMYLFFRITTNIETQKLVNMNIFFDPLYYKAEENFHYNKFIRSIAYKRKVQ